VFVPGAQNESGMPFLTVFEEFSHWKTWVTCPLENFRIFHCIFLVINWTCFLS